MKKILIIEDNKDLREQYSLAFASKEYQVASANNGLTGIGLAVDENPDLILLDIMMPDMDGLEFLNVLKNNTSKKIDVFVCTNLSDENVKKECLDLGVKSVILKSSYSPLDLVTFIETSLQEQKQN